MSSAKTSIDWSRIYLREDPFLAEPPLDPQRVVWAGVSKLRKQLESVITEALSSARTQVVLNRGIIGAGKTHAARYYSLHTNMPKVTVEKVKGMHHLYIQTPKEPDQAVKQLYRQMIEQISMTQLIEVLNKLTTELSQSDFIDRYQKLTGSEEFALALWKLGYSDDEEELNMLKRYFLLTGVTKAELKKLGLARSIESLLDQTSVLAAFLHSLIGISLDTAPSVHCRIFLWLDEMEDLVYYSARYYRPFSQALRDLVDRIPNFFTLFMNFTMTRPDREEEIDVILGAYLTDRITHTIRFEELNEEEGVEYITDLLTQYRIENFPQELPSSYPFKEEVLQELLRGLERRTPRDINKKCHELVEHAFKDNLFRTPGKDWIESSYLEKSA